MTLKRIFAFAATAIFVAVIGVVANGWFNGVRFYAVDSGSMSPTFDAGALVIDLPVTPATTYQVGDVVTFHPTPGYTATHRVVAIEKDGIATKGDANPSNDIGFIQPSMIAGRVAFSVPYGGYVAVFFQQPAGVAALLLMIIGLVVVWELTQSEPAAPSTVAALGEDTP